MAQRLEINQHIGQFLTQQQLRFVKLLEMNTPELEEAVERELESNPALEAIDAPPHADDGTLITKEEDSPPVYLRYVNNKDNNESRIDYENFSPDNSETLQDILRRQIDERNVPAEVRNMADYIIGNLDSNGYLERSLKGMLDDLAFNHGEEVSLQIGQDALALVRSLEPAGVGAEGIRDCLLLQLRRLPGSRERDDAIKILDEQFEAYHKRHSHKIISGLRMTNDRLNAANALILTLNPKPGAGYGGGSSVSSSIIVPDFTISREGDDFYISLTNRIPELAIDESFREAMRGLDNRRGRPRKGTEFISSSFSDARDFIKVLRQRQSTLFTVMTAILNRQKEYFISGDVYDMRPMKLKDLSVATGLDISVISRATANKYVSLPWGEIRPLRSFFSENISGHAYDKYKNEETQANNNHPGSTPENLSTSSDADSKPDNDLLTNRKIEAAISSLVESEDKRHPLSDEKIRESLEKSGYSISRRTVAKYRDRMGILIARLRKKL